MAKKKIEMEEVLENEKPTTKAPAKREKSKLEELPVVEEDFEPDYDVDEEETGSCECGCDDDCPCCNINGKIYTLLEILKSGTLDEDNRQTVQQKLMNLVEEL